MTIYHSFTKDKTTYHIVDKLSKSSTITFGHVYVTLTSKETDTHCPFKNCHKCQFTHVCDCTSNDNARLTEILKLAPNLLTNFPELGV